MSVAKKSIGAAANFKQYVVYKNKNPRTRTTYPYLLDVQTPLLESLQTRVIIPMIKATAFQKKVIEHVTPLVTFEGEKYLVLTPQLAGMAHGDLGAAAGDLARYRDDIVAALDFVFFGI